MLPYINPGAGALLIQLLVSLCIGAGFYLVRFRGRIGHWLRRTSREDEMVQEGSPGRQKR
jgi:hypothetical protein